jgi:L-2,4-diaminobutyrate decarboxylase
VEIGDDASGAAGAAADGLFVTSAEALAAGVGRAVDALARVVAEGAGAAWSGVPADRLAREVGGLDPCPEDGVGLDAALAGVEATVLANGVRTWSPATAAHLHCPAVIPAVVAELLVGATNQSLDSYDQAPAATLVEDHLVRWLGRLLGLAPAGSGVFTAGGTASNLLGLYLARDRAARRIGMDVARDGLPAVSPRWRIVASEAAHFSVAKAAGVLGLGRRAVVPVATDEAGRMSEPVLDQVLDRLDEDNTTVIAVVGTAGTTDHGAIDPLAALADRARARDAWFHVDAAVASAFALSDRLAPRLAGIEAADSVTVDFHKLWWQPISASALVVADAAALDAVTGHSDYLHRAEDVEEGQLNLVARSLDTSRRFDALKVLLSLRAVGRRRMAAMVEHLVDLAAHAAAGIEAHPDLELLAPAQTITALFRRRGPDDLNRRVARELFESGEAVIGRTAVGGRQALKLTFVNPRATTAEVDRLLRLVAGNA